MSSTEVGRAEQAQNEKQQIGPEKYGLDAIFAPSSVAVIGASDRPGTVGRTVLENLLYSSYQGKVYAINPKHEKVLGLKAYRDIRDIPRPVDLVVVATPAATVPPRPGSSRRWPCRESGCISTKNIRRVQEGRWGTYQRLGRRGKRRWSG